MKKKKSFSTFFLIFMLFVGLSVMLYPSFSDWWNTRTQSRAIAAYEQLVNEIDPVSYEAYFSAAEDYNRRLLNVASPFTESGKLSGYEDILDISGTGIIGYISIPFINIELPIYHGTSPEVLNIAAGHLEGSSLPVGGVNTHAVISAHRGLPSARLFTDLDKLVEGDIFTITILDQVLTYEIETILTVEPEDMDKLAVIPGGDYVTLMTCTPYGINTHRLLLRSHRIETIYERSVKVDPDGKKVDPMLVVPFISLPLLILLIIFWIITGKKKNYVINKGNYRRFIDG